MNDEALKWMNGPVGTQGTGLVATVLERGEWQKMQEGEEDDRVFMWNKAWA